MQNDHKYIQVKTALGAVTVKAVTPNESVTLLLGDTKHTTYLDAQKARQVAHALMNAANYLEFCHANV